MAFNATALVTGANAIEGEITHMQLHSSGTNPGANAIGSRVAVTGVVDGSGNITWSNIPFTGLPASSPVSFISYWTAPTGGTDRGGSAVTGDSAANAAGEYTVTSVTETASAS